MSYSGVYSCVWVSRQNSVAASLRKNRKLSSIKTYDIYTLLKRLLVATTMWQESLQLIKKFGKFVAGCETVWPSKP